MKSLFRHPKSPIIYIFLAATYIFFICIIAPALDSHHAGGEAYGIQFFVYSTDITICTYLIASFLFFIYNIKTENTSFIFIDIMVLIISSSLAIYSFIISNNESNNYDFKSYITIDRNDTIRVDREYFVNTDRIRSEKFWRNNRKDSVWTIYDENGRVIDKTKY